MAACPLHLHTNQCLDHLHPLVPHTLKVVEDAHCPLTPHLLEGQVQEDEGTGPPNPGTAVDEERCCQRGRVHLADTAEEGDE